MVSGVRSPWRAASMGTTGRRSLPIDPCSRCRPPAHLRASCPERSPCCEAGRRVGFGASGPQRRSWTGTASQRIADKCARLHRAATLVALRRGRETYETAALPLSYVGRRPSIGDEFRQQLFSRSIPNGARNSEESGEDQEYADAPACDASEHGLSDRSRGQGGPPHADARGRGANTVRPARPRSSPRHAARAARRPGPISEPITVQRSRAIPHGSRGWQAQCGRPREHVRRSGSGGFPRSSR